MKDRTLPPEVLRARIARVKTELRLRQKKLQDLQEELDIAEAEQRDREQMAGHDSSRTEVEGRAAR